tara:strand:- start:1094 stop:1939 length:846 start_codon:yes stop_codon:yes gene_type:complete
VTNLFLCSFASPDLGRSVKRFIKQSNEISLYKDYKIFGWKDLSLNKKKQIKNFFKKGNKRLFGYACWKPEIILNYLNSLPKESILQYSDIGCHLNKNGMQRLKFYLETTNKNNILAFQYKKPEFEMINKNLKYQIYYENEYTKGDLFNYFKLPIDSQIRKSEQVWSGTVFFKNNSITKNFLKEWNDVCCKMNLIDDSPSIEMNSEEFIEHRHDQSIFSILCKINSIFCLSASEIEWAEDEKGRYWEHLDSHPILAKRDKKMNIFKRFFLRQFKNINRIFNK